MPGVKYDMTFTSWVKFTVDDFKNNIKTRYVNQSKHNSHTSKIYF